MIFGKAIMRFLFTCILLIVSSSIFAASFEGIRSSTTESGTRLVVDLKHSPDYSIFSLKNPARLVIDLKSTSAEKNAVPPQIKSEAIKKIRYGHPKAGTFRIVLDLSKSIKYQSQTLAPNSNYPYRLVLDIEHQKAKPVPSVTKIEPKPAPKPQPAVTKTETEKVATQATPEPTPVKITKPIKRRDIVIAIDPGHGGKDSGALGKRGTKEKDVVLAIARKLAALIKDEPGMRAYMTRNSDVFIRLRDRIKRARDNGADMFISIHADAFRNHKAKGASVYVLSERGASSEAAKLLADKENAADLAGGISLEDKDDLLASVLLDLSQTASLEGSLEVANTVLSGLKRVGYVHKKHVESAGFVVLKSPDIPSILVETAFISNPDEERKLRNPRHQTKLAKAMLVGIRDYFRRNPLPGSTLQQQHIVSRGDTLSTIAQRYQVSMLDLKKYNNLNNNMLKIGEVLTIP